ncbi:MAG: penicillin-insensitive murein endopeptidase [Nitrospinota bacterium]|nr:penicillin-insensitive murein endopeptidase [Nitrospinota bacterium]
MSFCQSKYAITTLIFLSVLLAPIPSQGAHSGSICYGSTSKGRLENGVQLPMEGPNFIGYSRLGHALGRTFVHDKVKTSLLIAYQKLQIETPGKVFKYAETGNKKGGSFYPHKSHQNGLSVDFMVPVIDQKGRSVHLPSNIWNKFGYSIEFDQYGKYETGAYIYRIDFESMATHLSMLAKAAKETGIDVDLVIFDPKLQPKLFATRIGPYLKKNLRFSKKRSWVRHDEHYHVNFKVQCK